LPLVQYGMDMTEISATTVVVGLLAMAGVFVFFSRATSKWSRLAIRIISGVVVTVGCLVVAFLILRGKLEEHVVELQNGAFKIRVRSQEFGHSSIRNIDICS
jgi:hypothetical protein